LEGKLHKILKGWAEEMTGFLTMQERAEWINESFQKGTFPIGDMSWYKDLHFDFY